MKFGEYLKNRDPQFATGVNEMFGFGGPTLSPEQQEIYQQHKNEVDQLMQDYKRAGQRVALPDAIAEFMKNGGMQLANMRRNQGLKPPQDLRAAPQQGRERQLNKFNVAQRHQGTL
jgi:hypothetical protein